MQRSLWPKLASLRLVLLDDTTALVKPSTQLVQFLVSVTLLALPAVVQAQLVLATNGSTIAVIGYTGSPTAVTIPDTTNGLPITSIGTAAFEWSSLTSVTIGTNVTSIGDRAFRICTNLNSITIPNSVTNIGSSAFYACIGLTSVTIPNGVTSIGVAAFANCNSLTNIAVNASNPAYSCVGGVLFDKNQTTLIQYGEAKPVTIRSRQASPIYWARGI